MGNVDEGQGPLPVGLTPEVSRAVLCYDIVHIGPGGGDDRPLGVDQHDLGDGVVFGGGAHGQDGFPTLGHEGTPDVVHLASDAGVLLAVDKLSRHLTVEVH